MSEQGTNPNPIPPAPLVVPPASTNRHVTKRVLAFATVAILGVILIHLLFFDHKFSFRTPSTRFAQIYTLVEDKISQNGVVLVGVPKGVGKEEARKGISFTPEIAGEWVSSDIADTIAYKPRASLELGKHYTVTLKTQDGEIQKDFRVDEDPRVVSVFPDNAGEAELDSEITITFNRPMVPLTTLSVTEERDIPVTIQPQTAGKFKWIGTRTLQFTPERGLIGSTQYRVRIGENFFSMDGLSVPVKEYEFVTKALRLERTTLDTTDTLSYSQPIQFFFNQPVDLEKTAREISLTNADGARVEPSVVYGTRQVWDELTSKYRQIKDRSILSVVPKNILNGRSGVWEYSSNYSAVLGRAYPLGGEVPIEGALRNPLSRVAIRTTSITKEVTVTSEKTNLASQDLFDPEGELIVSFFDEIDVSRSVIRAKGLRNIGYSKKCAEDEYGGSGCTKVDDKSRLVIHFSSVFREGEEVPLTLSKIVNTEGYEIHKEPIVITLRVYPELKVLRTKPLSGSSEANISELALCTNAPLLPQSAKEFYTNASANKYMVFGRWDPAYLQTANEWEKDPPCLPGEFVNRIHYGLLPLESYQIGLKVNDVFGRAAELSLSLNTERAPKFYLRFQSLQKVYNVTTPDKTMLTYATENFDFVNVHVCKVSAENMVRTLAAEPKEISTATPGSLPCQQVVEKRVQLKADQWVNQYFQINVKDFFADPRGQFVLSFSHPQYVDERGIQLFARSYLSVTNLAVVDHRVKWTSYDYLPDVPNLTKADLRGSVYWISQMKTLEAEAGARIAVYQYTEAYRRDAPVILARTAQANTQGIAEFPLIADVAGAAITSGDESAVVSPWADTLNQGSWSNAYQDEKVYLYTDRPIYRPGQEVFIKGLYRVDFDGSYEVFRDADIHLKVFNSKGDSVLEQRVPVSAFGTFSTKLKLPQDAPLGSYYVSARNNSAFFDVEEYVGAAFETKVTTDKEEYTAGETADVRVNAAYYFGVPLDGGELEYSITSQNYYFDRYRDGYFSFGNYWYECYDCGYGDTYLKGGKVSLDSAGSAQLAVPLAFDEYFKDANKNQSKIFVVHGTVKDRQGKSVSFQKSFIVHRGDYYVGVKADPSFSGTLQPFTIRVKSVDVQGKPVAKSGITVLVQKVGWESNKRQEVDGGFYSRPQRVLKEVVKKYAATNGSGDYSAELEFSEPGEYEVTASGKDARGNEIQGATSVYIFGEGSVDIRPTNNATLTMNVEQKDVRKGDKARFVVQNPYERAKALISIQRGRIFSYEVLDINQNMFEYSFPVLEEHTPNVFASVVLLSSRPEVKFGTVEYTVDRKSKELQIEVQSEKASYLPGEEVSLNVTTKDTDGRPVSAEVSLAVADLSVLALKGNPKIDPLLFFYSGYPLAVSAETNVKNLLEETPIPTGTKGGDGGSPQDLAKKKRGEFRDTAFWKADVTTDATGRARISFKLPDNLTKWQVEALGITKDTRLGVQYRELFAQKDLMAVPLSPRFVVPGDEFSIGAKVFNQTMLPQNISVSLSSETLEIEDRPQRELTIKPGDSTTLYFRVKAPLSLSEGSHSFTVAAKNASLDDTVEISIPITRNETYESTATAGSSEDSSVREYIYLPNSVLSDRGGLTVKKSATLAVYLGDAFKYLFAYPYGCSEQLASKLSAIAIAKRALSVPNVGSEFAAPKIWFDGKEYSSSEAVEIGLQQIYENQTAEGGFSYFKGLQSNPYLTIAVLNSLADLKEAGYVVRAEVVSRANSYLYREIQKNGRDSALSNSTDSLILAAYTLSRTDRTGGSFGSLLNTVVSRASRSYLADKASTQTLAYLALLSARGQTSAAFRETVFATLLNRVSIDSRGAYVKTEENAVNWNYYETPEQNTALTIKALVAAKREYSETPNLIRWLVASRSKDGSWGSTNASVIAIGALADYLTWKRETESQFSLETNLDDSNISRDEFSKKNILSTFSTYLPISDISQGKVHTLTFTKTNKNNLANAFYYDMRLTYFLPV
ncbi:MAG: hypothetical protein RIQ56_910, partial [Candidatus Parcubacteria bacterium]